MRDVGLIAIVVGLSAYALLHPWVGVLAWTWLSVMNPHSYTWAAASMPLAAMVAGSTLIGLVVTRDRRQLFVTRETAMLMLFMLWVSATLPFSFSPSGSYEMWNKVMKVDLMILVTLALLHSKQHILWFVGVVVFSLGFYGVKGGLFTIVTGGNHRVWGPGGFIGGNNEVALAFVMVIPLMRFLQLQFTQAWIRFAWTLAMVLTAAAALGSHSRGAFLAMAAMATFLWLKSRSKLMLGAFILLAAVGLVMFMPSEWDTRMESIADYENDGSAMGRINAWWMAFNLARANVAGGGFDIYDVQTFSQYAPNPLDVHAAHSIYFQVLGEHGFPGLFIYILIWWFVWRSAGDLVRKKNHLADTAWCSELGAMAQVSLVGFAVGGAFLSLAYFDLPYNILVMVVLAKRWMAPPEPHLPKLLAPGTQDRRELTVGHRPTSRAGHP